MSLLAVAALVLAVVLTRELVRGMAQRRMPRVREMFDLTKQPVGVTLAGLAGTYLAVATLAFTYAAVYGLPTGTRYFGVGEVLANGAAVGKLETGDRIERFDGEPVFVGSHSLVERVNAKRGAPFHLDIVRDGERSTVFIAPKQGTDKQGKQLWLIGIRPVVDEERTRGNATPFALTYPARHVVQLVRDIGGWARGGAEVGSVVRIAEEFRRQSTGDRIFKGALQLAGHAFVLFALLDLIRLAIAIRDRLRG